MDIRMYFQKIREVERSIPEEYPVVVSLETPEGGKAGVSTEVTREIAAKLIVESKARLATKQEAETFHADAKAALAALEEERLASRIQFTVVPDSAIRGSKGRSEKG